SFQAEDGIRDFHVTGVQTCALPICSIAVVIVHVQHRKLGGPLVAPSLGSDGRIVEEAVAAVVVRGCMVPWWTTEGEDSAPSLSRSEERRVGEGRCSGVAPERHRANW